MGQSRGGLSLSLCYTLCLLISFCGYFVPPSKKDQSIHTLLFLLELQLVSELYLGYSEFLGGHSIIFEFIQRVGFFVIW